MAHVFTFINTNSIFLTYWSLLLGYRVARFIFSKKAKPSIKKGQKWPTQLLKENKHSIKKGHPSLDKAKFIKQFACSQLKFT